MKKENEIIKAACDKFPYLTDKIYIQKEKRIFTKPLLSEEFEALITYAHDELGFSRASHVVGTDDGENIGLLYILSDSDEILFALRESTPKSNPLVNSMSEMYPALVLNEREIADLFGVKFNNLLKGPRYPLPDCWPENNYPMRKEWNPEFFNKETMNYEEPQEKEAEKNE